MNDFNPDLAAVIAEMAKPIPTREERENEKHRKAREIIRAWMFEQDCQSAEEVMEAEDGELAAKLLGTWPNCDLAEVIVETTYFNARGRPDFECDLTDAMKEGYASQYCRLGEQIARNATRYILSCHRSDIESVIEQDAGDWKAAEDDRMAEMEERQDGRRDDRLCEDRR